MIQRVGIALLFIGMVMFVTSCVLFGSVGLRAAAANKALSVPLESEKPQTTDLVNVDTSRLCSVGVAVKVESDKVYTNKIFDHKTRKDVEEHTLQYAFLIRYRVLDESNHVIHEQTDKVAWNSGMRTGGEGKVSSADGGVVENEHHFAKFKVPPPGRIRVDVELGADEEYGATLHGATLTVYDNVSKHSDSLLGGFALICFSPLMIVFGAILLLVGTLRAPSRRGRNQV